MYLYFLYISLFIYIIMSTYIIYNLYTKNIKLENLLINRNDYINTISNIIIKINKKINQLDHKGIFRSDDEIGTFFDEIKKINDILNNIKN